MYPLPAPAQPTPAVPLLESYDNQIRQDRHGNEEAQALPRSMTICADRAAKRCWTEAGVTACETEEEMAEVFAVVGVSGDESEGPGVLERCWSEMKGRAD